MPDSGWGSAPWGGFPWGLAGGVTPASVELAEAVAIRENMVQLFFVEELEFTGLLGLNDASDPTHYAVTPVAGTIGSDGLPARSVGVLLVENVADGGIPGSIVNLTLDRPLSPYPAQYLVTVQNLVTIPMTVLNPTNANATFFGTQQPAPNLTVQQSLPSRDIAHPDTLEAALDPLPNAQDPTVLGSIPTGSDGDYAFDEGIVNLKKRVFRRLTTTKGRFLHLGASYGVGVQNYLKRLNIPSVRQQIAADAESQISQEPDVQKVKVRVVVSVDVPEQSRFVILIKPVAGKPVRFDAPLIAL